MTLIATRRWALRALLILAPLTGAVAAGAEPPDPGLVIAFHAKAADRTALRTALETTQPARLRRWQADGLLTGYRLLFARYADGGGWDAMELLSFKDAAAMSRWRATERAAPGGLDARALALVTSIDTTPTDHIRGGGADRATDPAVLVVPYVSLIPAADYARYLDGYTIRQFEGWIAEGVLDGYDIFTSKYPAGRDWNALIVLRYNDDAALGRRDEVVGRTRARLVLDPAWKAISDDKKSVRTEKILVVADQIAAARAQ